ncbi:MAG TPA: tetratricopeptide repeat protein, partial [Candidatus Polarisedimenticolia bacterium]|nr:tetratricopeptide repeat protein [Candidatus Polarisedimenticolia bacterium]
PFGYRLLNLLLHLVVTILVFLLAERIAPPGKSRTPIDPAVAAGLLFAVHPVHTEVLGEVVGRAELLAAAGTLGCVLAFLRGRDAEQCGGRPWGWYGIAIVSFALGFLAKENAIVAPFLVVAIDLLVVRRGLRWRFHLSAAAALALCLGARIAAIGGLHPAGHVHYIDNPIAHLPFLEGRLTALDVLGRYAGLLVAPLRLSIDYSHNAIPAAGGPFAPRVLFGALLLAGWMGALLVSGKRRPATTFALAWIGLAMAPTSNLFIPIGTIMAERLLYLPSAGFCLLVGLAVAGLSRTAGEQRRRSGAIRVAAAVIVALLAVRGLVRLGDWRDDRTIFRRAIEVVPDSVRAQYNYGAASEDAGDDAAAEEAYATAIAIWPAFSDAQYNLAGLYARQSRWEEAVRHYRLAVREQPANVQYLVNLGRSLTAQGSPGEAAELLERAIAIDPSSDLALTNLGAARLALDDAAGAALAYRGALRLAPDNPDYLRNLALAQRRQGDLDGAEKTLVEALAIRPDEPELLLALGLTRLEAGRTESALAALRRAVELLPGHPVFRYHMGQALEAAGLEGAAADAYREAIRIAPDSPVPYRNLGLLLERAGDRPGALRALERCAALDADGQVLGEEGRAMLERLRRGAPNR